MFNRKYIDSIDNENEQSLNNDTRQSETSPEAKINSIKSKAQQLLNSSAIHSLQNRSSDNYISATASLAILQFLASLIDDRRDESIKDTSKEDNSIHEAIKITRSLLEGKSDLTGNEVTVLHNIWLKNGSKLNKNVQKLVAKFYNCETKILPLTNNNVNIQKLTKKLQKLDESRRFTEDLCRDVFYKISPQDILLTSVFWAEMRWREPFLNSLTTDGTFHISEDEIIDVEMMVQKCGLVCVTSDNLSATVLQLPLTAHNMCILVYLPYDNTKGVDAISRNLTPEIFEALIIRLNGSKPKPVYVTLPKFTLKECGMTSKSFCEPEESKIIESDRVLAPGCKIFQTTKLTLNEYGLNASKRKTDQSESTVIGPAVHDGIKWTHFTASSPFLITLVDVEYKLIFLAGKVGRPEQNNDRWRSGGKADRNWCCI